MLRILALVSLTLLLTSCRAPGGDGAREAGDMAGAASDAAGVAVRIELPDDPQVGPAGVDVYLLEDGSGVEGAEVEVTGTMSHAGMEPVVREAAPVEPGLYRTDDFAFTMAGDWIVFVDATLDDGRTVRSETTVTVRRP